jgi:hypothetical protein
MAPRSPSARITEKLNCAAQLIGAAASPRSQPSPYPYGAQRCGPVTVTCVLTGLPSDADSTNTALNHLHPGIVFTARRQYARGRPSRPQPDRILMLEHRFPSRDARVTSPRRPLGGQILASDRLPSTLFSENTSTTTPLNSTPSRWSQANASLPSNPPFPRRPALQHTEHLVLPIAVCRRCDTTPTSATHRRYRRPRRHATLAIQTNRAFGGVIPRSTPSPWR